MFRIQKNFYVFSLNSIFCPHFYCQFFILFLIFILIFILILITFVLFLFLDHIAPYGWTYIIEEEYFDSTFVQYLRLARKEARIEKIVLNFMNEMNNRNKMNTLCGWLQYSYRRVKARNHIINLSMKWKYANAGTILIYFYFTISLLFLFSM